MNTSRHILTRYLESPNPGKLIRIDITEIDCNHSAKPYRHPPTIEIVAYTPPEPDQRPDQLPDPDILLCSPTIDDHPAVEASDVVDRYSEIQHDQWIVLDRPEIDDQAADDRQDR
ncbi:MAG: hypothetical protein JRD89_16430 [Deltaproteobacteria bacterium]|nr:hypothetical protein [Deltaproteobacteria bacterium]